MTKKQKSLQCESVNSYWNAPQEKHTIGIFHDISKAESKQEVNYYLQVNWSGVIVLSFFAGECDIAHLNSKWQRVHVRGAN